jgi:CheY-like chemotaxis protein
MISTAGWQIMADKKIVLAIDDNLQQLSEFKGMLVPNYGLRVVKSAPEAMSYLNKDRADIILLDIEMPNISGFEFLDDIKKIPSYIDTPVIIISGSSGQDFVNKAKTLGAAAVLTKPVDPNLLINTIEEVLAATS